MSRSYCFVGTLATVAIINGIGCASDGTTRQPETDPAIGAAAGTSIEPTTTRHVEATSLVRRLATIPDLRARLSLDSSTKPSSLRVTAPAFASDPIRLEVEGHAGAWTEVTAIGARAAPGENVGAARVYRDALESTDLVHVVGNGMAEEIRWLRDESAEATARYRLRVGPEIAAVRIREGHVELVDAGGYVLLATAPMYAIDAAGVRRSLSVSMQDGRPDVVVAALDTRALKFPIAVDPLWSAAGSLSTLRTAFHPVALAGGKVLVAGGTGVVAGGPISSAEIYDVATNTWSTVASMKGARNGAGVTYFTAGIGAGKVLVAGGNNGGALSTAEIYTVATNAWSDATAMSVARSEVILTTIGAGSRALLVDGTTKSEVYDPATNAWTVTSAMPVAQGSGSISTLLPDGRVLVTGGGIFLMSSTKATAIFTAAGAGGSWVAAASMIQQRDAHSAIVVGGKVLAAGGGYWGPKAGGFTRYPTVTTELFDPVANTWTAKASLATAANFGATLSNGRGYLFEAASLEVYDPAGPGTLSSGGASTAGLNGVMLSSGTQVLLIGGNGDANQLFSLAGGGTTCTLPYECATGFCTGGACCSTATCPSGSVCSAPVKPGVCGKLNGTTCATASECDSGSCVDGVCCNSACGGQCQACDVPGKSGTCSAVFGAPHGSRVVCGGASATDPCLKEVCNGADTTACHFPGAGVPCGADTCVTGIETHVSACDGAGKCGDVPKSCGSYSCGPTACRTTCGVPPDCTAGYYCDTTKATCVPLTGLGKKCDATSPCGPGLFCTDGYCCGKASCGAGSSCGITGKEGTCAKKNGFACTNAAECGSGVCADSVCCDLACNGQCEACDVKGSEGACTPVTGAPHGTTRAACATDATNVCANAICDGSDRSKCASFAGSDKECRPASCKAGALTARAACDGKGACPAAIATPCNGFKCDDAGLACKSACTTEADCVDGFTCKGGACTKKAGSCTADGTAVQNPDGTRTSCAPFACKAGACVDRCATSDDCVGGTTCNDAKVCVGAATSGDSGGCSIGATNGVGRAGLGAWALTLGLAAVLHRRRRARRV